MCTHSSGCVLMIVGVYSQQWVCTDDSGCVLTAVGVYSQCKCVFHPSPDQ